MNIFSGNDINSIYLNALQQIIHRNIDFTPSRCGAVLDFGPTFFEFTNPENQLLILKKRKFNPFFAVIEAAWVLSGSNKLANLQSVLSNYDKFSNDGETLNGAYGYRMQHYFKSNQLDDSIELLKKDKSTRRAVISLYSTSDLTNNDSLDIPCNTSIFLKIRDNKLDLTVINRSNDLFLGIPYNAFVFNTVQKFIAKQLDIGIGYQRHFTDCLHIYKRDLEKIRTIINSNNQETIDKWTKNLDGYNALSEGILSDFHAISEMNTPSISNTYCKDVIGNYLHYKASSDKIQLENSLPNDIFGLSVKLWLHSLNK